MGIPSFYKWITKKYPDILINNNNIKCDNLYLDMNGIIHPCSESSNLHTSINDIYFSIINFIDSLVDLAKPKQMLYLAIDGVAPRSKINQQRSRRFLSKESSKEKLINKKKLELNLNIFNFDKNSISPGTEFMYNLSLFLQEQIKLRKNNTWQHIKVILSDSNDPGEGEHKIMNYIRTLTNNNLHHVIFGNDSDLFMLGLSSHLDNFLIMREQYKNNKMCEICNSPSHKFNNCEGNIKKIIKTHEFIYADVYILKKYLVKDLNIDNNYKDNNLIDDWIFLCFFVGNDFLPHLHVMEINENAINLLMIIYKKYLKILNQYLTLDTTINYEFIKLIMEELYINEKRIFYKRYKSIKTKIQYNKPGYEDRYYTEKFSISSNKLYTKNFINLIVNEYVIGLAWVLKYYLTGCPSWDWYYPFHYAPMCKSFLNINYINYNFELSKPLKPLVQLMAILPYSNYNLVPEAWKFLMRDKNSPIIDFYPKRVKIDQNDNKIKWKVILLFDFIDVNYLKSILNEYYINLTDLEKLRNKSSKIMYFT